MQDIIDIAGKTTLSADDYAAKHGISRRTVSRHIKQGKLEALKRSGRTYIVDLEPADTAIRTESAGRLDTQDADTGQAVRQADDDLLKLQQLLAKANAGHPWRHLAIVFILAASVAAPAGVWIYSSWKSSAEALVSRLESTTTISADLATATTTIKQLQDDLSQAMANANERALDAALESSYRAVNQSLREALATTRQKLADERKRTANLEATLNNLTDLYGRTANDPGTGVTRNPRDP
jgi:hypothetical protein